MSKVIMIIAGFVTTVYRKPGRAFEAVGGKLESESPTQLFVYYMLLRMGIKQPAIRQRGQVYFVDIWY